ncbi:hypothetical protein E2493_09810 [Sphingomonas parva]|uniref:Uncharacterized protein n=1 Tax=Sphingomonas parva TaxID=2555898 RepID=A0A4Y8ZQY4_9SPHN|nr:restriction endonuclease [Sphingomonas parva]TFI58421.1 hypothetical protein E2493_09810 [Sphingomonas parva]
MAPVTRTLGPLHLEDLEPHRFEDLVRQLLYDFRSWRDLEATGRTGSDEGFDARATELVYGAEAVELESLEGALSGGAVEERQWLIQCKREKAIGPKKIEGYLEGLPSAREARLYGLIFAAACDFSIEARDRFYARARDLGFQEAKLWGKGEIEDQLYQPKNDHLLFAYFGVSLQTRRRSIKTEVRSRLAMKRKAKRLLQPHTSVMVRDASDDRYPFLDRTEQPRRVRGRWAVYRFGKCGAFGVELLFRRHFAFIDDDGEHWDYAERMNDAPPHDDPLPDPERPETDAARAEAFDQWSSLPEGNRAWYELMLVLPYESIIDIDEDGDDYFDGPHIYVQPFVPEGNGPFAEFKLVHLFAMSSWGRSCRDDDGRRMALFPRHQAVEDGVAGNTDAAASGSI